MGGWVPVQYTSMALRNVSKYGKILSYGIDDQLSIINALPFQTLLYCCSANLNQILQLFHKLLNSVVWYKIIKIIYLGSSVVASLAARV